MRSAAPICSISSGSDSDIVLDLIYNTHTKDSNIRDISENETYLDDVFDLLREKYRFPVEQSAIYYLFDRDPKSNTDSAMIEKYIVSLSNPYDNDDYKAGQLLLSYPSILLPQLTIEFFACPTAGSRRQKTLKYPHIPAVFFLVLRQRFFA